MNDQQTECKVPLFFFSWLLVSALFFCWSEPALAKAARLATGDRFPLYPCIRANVKFWEDVYSRYSTRQGILHDRNDLSRIYAVIDLVDWRTFDAARQNGERVNAARSRISDILDRLGNGVPPRTAEERRIASLFPQRRHTIYHQARDNIRMQVGQSDRFYEGLVRSGRYMPHFRRIFTEEGLPPELAYLPHVESSFNPKAQSKSGAAGLWQFTRATGKEYMMVNDLVDERFDPYVSAKAAARLLKENYRQLNNWPLAITAYNHGRAGMVRAVREMGSYERIFTSYDQGSFKFASRNFYPEFLAAMRVSKRLAANPKFPFERPEALTSLRLAEDTSVGRLRSTYRLSAEDFARLNPALKPTVLTGKAMVPRGYLVRLPADRQQRTAYLAR